MVKLIQEQQVLSYDGASDSVIQYIKINQLKDFHQHPFKVEVDKGLFELMKSIEMEGVLVPLIARPNPEGEGFEIIAGHRRKEASKWAGIDEIPVVIKNLDDNQAIIAMIDSNLQRENIKPSEKAFAYKMKLDAMKRQGKRTDLTFYPVDKKLDDPMETSNANQELSNIVGESTAQISRYIRLTNLIPNILDMVDNEQIAFRTAVELSYLTTPQQYDLFAVMDLEQCTPSLSQANRLKRMSQSGTLEMDQMYEILQEKKPNQREQIKIQANKLAPYFPKEFTPQQKVELIETLVKRWYQTERQKVGKGPKR